MFFFFIIISYVGHAQWQEVTYVIVIVLTQGFYQAHDDWWDPFQELVIQLGVP